MSSDSTLPARNAAAVEQALRDLTAKVLSQQARMDGLVSTVGSLSARVAEVERDVAMRRASGIGTGPTVK